MTQGEQDATAQPQFSIVIPVYEDWLPLERCLQSLAKQEGAPAFEVIVVDDGSKGSIPELRHIAADRYPLTIIQQVHRGIPSARNSGIRMSEGKVLLFVDADCRLDVNCLASLNATVLRSPQHSCFQLRLVGNPSSLVGRAEDLRLKTFQKLMLQTEARIRYLNTAGFAIRRDRVSMENDIFDPVALRAEDTLLLANLMQSGELPVFVSNAVVEHLIPLSLLQCLRKDIKSVYLERRAYDMITAKGLRIRLTHRERLRLLWSMWKTAGQDSIGRSAWFVVVLRQAFQRTISLGVHCLPLGDGEGV
jgi:glycosyltransferase involved in cell wall biosynthesis